MGIGLDVRGHIHLHIAHPGQRTDGINGLPAKLFLHRACRGGQFNCEAHAPALDGDVLHKAKADNVLVEIRIDNAAQCIEHLLFCNDGHAASCDRAARLNTPVFLSSLTDARASGRLETSIGGKPSLKKQYTVRDGLPILRRCPNLH